MIPKVESPSKLGGFCFIPMLKIIYKLVAKVIVLRLVKVMDRLIFSNQSASVKGRLLVYVVVDLNELVDLEKKNQESMSYYQNEFSKGL